MGALILFHSGAQVCHALRVEEFSEQLVVEEEADRRKRKKQKVEKRVKEN